MTDAKRAAIAFICGVKYNNQSSAIRLYDYSRKMYVPFSIIMDNYSFNVYDYFRNSYISGNDSQIYDYQTNSYIRITMGHSAFDGYDFMSGFYFQGSVNKNNIMIYDYEFSQYYYYSIY